MRSKFTISLAFTFAIIFVSYFFVSTPLNTVSADEIAQTVQPGGGGEAPNMASDQMSEAERKSIMTANQKSIERLMREGKIAAAVPQAVPLSWPVRRAANAPDYSVDAISNYVDQNVAFPNQLLDWNCGTRTYDQASGYNHAGIDIFTWPFAFHKMDNNHAEIVAAAPGTIINKFDGNFDRQCGFGAGNWNAVYVRHSDNSVAWYGHMKNGSLTAKIVGDSVAAGEKLGIVGSSGNSTGPHLHFELYNASNQLQDPFQGTCNTLNNFSWWAAQESYRVSRINRVMVGSAAPVFPSCPTTESPNEKRVYQPGETIFTSTYYRDQLTSQQTSYSVIRPDGSTFQTWTHNSPNTYSASYWWWSWVLPSNAPRGVWKFRASYNSAVYEQTFTVGSSSPFDIDGDNKTDVSIYRVNGSSQGEWWWLNSSNGSNRAMNFGTATDVIVPADFSGDQRADLAFWRPSTGFWYVLRSEDFSFYAVPFGTNGDVPVPADFDADGKADTAVFRTASSTWFVNKSSGGTDIFTFGTLGDRPTPADYDGDGKADVAIYRPNAVGGGQWWIRRSSTGVVTALVFGISTDKTVVGDYTGDGKADIAVWRPSNGFWNVLRSEDLSYFAFPFGTNGDLPVPGDYDGDGRTDAAVFRPSNSTWYIQRSTAGNLIQQFGTTGDTPLPNAFVR